MRFLYLIIFLFSFQFNFAQDNLEALKKIEDIYYEELAKTNNPKERGTLLAEMWPQFDRLLDEGDFKEKYLRTKLQELLDIEFVETMNKFWMKVSLSNQLYIEDVRLYLTPFTIDNQIPLLIEYNQSQWNGKSNDHLPKPGIGWTDYISQQKSTNNISTSSISTKTPTQKSIYIPARKLKITNDLDINPDDKTYCHFWEVFTYNNSTSGQTIRLEGYYYYKDYGSKQDGYLKLPGALYDQKFTDDELIYMAITTANTIYPSAVWLTTDNVEKCFILERKYKKSGDQGLIIVYEDNEGQFREVKIEKGGYDNGQTNIRVIISII